MPVNTWGDLPKSQIDNQLITEAIDLAIANHEADPVSHMGVGESIDMHRKNEVIDHLAGSIVPDKASFMQREYWTFFEGIAGWQKQGTVINSFTNLLVGVYGNAVSDAYCYSEDIIFDTFADNIINDNYIQFNFIYDNFYNIADLYFGVGITDDPGGTGFFLGYKIVGTTLYTGVAVDSAIVWTSRGTISQNAIHVFRIETLKEANTAYFYLDGLVIASYHFTQSDLTGFNSFCFYVDKTGGTTNAQFKGINTKYFVFYNASYGV
jgi:hypothetical protein